MLGKFLRNLKINIVGKPCIRTVKSNSCTKMEQSSMFQTITNCIPALDNDKYKGQAGRIGVIGGSLEYTGAPYFSGISALKVGADIVHIFCPPAAAPVIKSYSPELIVHPLLERKDAVAEISPWFDRLHTIVIGPGLGREEATFKVVSELIAVIKEKKIPLVIDADGLFLVTERPELLQNFSSPVILTPNRVENQRLNKAGSILDTDGFISVLRKGEVDTFISSIVESGWELEKGGSGRRCGGQGDLLSGAIATFLNWTLINKDYIDTNINKNAAAASLAAFAASVLVRRCNEMAFKIKGRSMLASDMIEHIHAAFEELYGQ